MEHYIIGSRLFKTLFPTNDRIQKRVKETADYDVLIDHEPTEEDTKYFKSIYGNKTECHCIPAFWYEWKYLPELSFETLTDKLKFKQNLYFTLKASHASFDSVQKDKTFFDLYLMDEEGCQIIEPLFYKLHEYWTEKFGEKWRADFTKESSEFFNDAVSRENVHDELHKSCAFYDQPAFKFIQEPDQTTVWVCPDKFKATTEHIRQRVVIEEAETLALERFILPGVMSNKVIAYQKMVKALVDRLAPLWMTIYIVNNIKFFMDFREDYGKSYINQ